MITKPSGLNTSSLLVQRGAVENRPSLILRVTNPQGQVLNGEFLMCHSQFVLVRFASSAAPYE
jgi:hypothetical protein